MNLSELKTKVVKILEEKKITISTCESATAGAIASNICDIPGASQIIKEAYIVYSNEAKIKILNVNENLIEKYGVVSKEVAISMAKNLYAITSANICISITGNLGPDALENKKAGLVYIGMSINGKETYYYECNFDGDRLEIKSKVVNKAFELIYDYVKTL